MLLIESSGQLSDFYESLWTEAIFSSFFSYVFVLRIVSLLGLGEFEFFLRAWSPLVVGWLDGDKQDRFLSSKVDSSLRITFLSFVSWFTRIEENLYLGS